MNMVLGSFQKFVRKINNEQLYTSIIPEKISEPIWLFFYLSELDLSYLDHLFSQSKFLLIA